MTHYQLIVYNKDKETYYQLIVYRNEVYEIDFHSPHNQVIDFLDRVRTLLQNDANFIFIKKRRIEKKNPKYTTESCMLELEYNDNDVINEISSLSIKHYYQTFFDDKCRGKEPWFVFIKELQKKQVYIKIKIREREDGDRVVCISFHFVEHEVYNLPYA